MLFVQKAKKTKYCNYLMLLKDVALYKYKHNSGFMALMNFRGMLVKRRDGDDNKFFQSMR